MFSSSQQVAGTKEPFDDTSQRGSSQELPTGRTLLDQLVSITLAKIGGHSNWLAVQHALQHRRQCTGCTGCIEKSLQLAQVMSDSEFASYLSKATANQQLSPIRIWTWKLIKLWTMPHQGLLPSVLLTAGSCSPMLND
jgi:hypothetical protein